MLELDPVAAAYRDGRRKGERDLQAWQRAVKVYGRLHPEIDLEIAKLETSRLIAEAGAKTPEALWDGVSDHSPRSF